MKRTLIALALGSTFMTLAGCGTYAKTQAAWDSWRANANEKGGNYGTAADYRRKERLNRAEAKRHKF